MSTARHTALQALLRWTHPADPPLIPDRDAADPSGAWRNLAPRDRAFAFDLLTGVIRWRATLDAVIASRLQQPLASLDHPVRALLWLGAYQLLIQSGTADYAAVDTTVALARRHRPAAKAAGLINAVLRAITRLNPRRIASPLPQFSRRALALDFQAHLLLDTDIFPNPADLTAHLAAVRSHPAPYVDFLRKAFGDALASDLLLRNNLRPLITLRADSASLDAPVAAGLQPHPTPHFLIAAAGWNDALADLIRTGKLSPQDPTAAKPVQALRELQPQPTTIFDLCAGLGTKTIQLARAFPQAKITASDIDPAKLARLATRAKDLHLDNIAAATPVQIENRKSKMGGGENLFDAVLVDVPCSNTGVLARRVQSRWRWPVLDHAALHALQLQLLHQGASLLAPHGAIIYSTCSLDPAENQQLVAAFLASHPFTLLREETTLPSLADTPTSPHDGGYFALLQPKNRA